VLTIKLRVTGVCRAGNTIITGAGCVLATAVNTGIRGTTHPVITVGSIQTVYTLFMDFITLQWRHAGISTVLTACNGIAGLCSVTVVTVIAGRVKGCVLTIILGITGICRAGNTISTGPVAGLVLAATASTGVRGTADTVITVGSIQTIHALFMGLITQ
jgi:hypothetical protein